MPGNHSSGSPRWRDGGLWFPGIRYLAQDCLLAEIQSASLGIVPAERGRLDLRQQAILGQIANAGKPQAAIPPARRPAETRIALSGSPRWRDGGLWFPGIRYLAQDCLLAEIWQPLSDRQQ
jgi:hypothetical protein